VSATTSARRGSDSRLLTIFSCPKSFQDPHIATIQRNAIRSWLLLDLQPKVILFGDDGGVAEAAAELGVAHVAEVARNRYGTPLLNDVFEKAEQLAETPLLCYANADIILMSDFARAVRLVYPKKKRFMLGGRPWDVPIREPMAFDDGWEDALRRLKTSGSGLRTDWACDYFLFPSGFWKALPPFAIGRAYFDNALMDRCRRQGGSLIDATSAITAIHQSHPYPAHLSGTMYVLNPEAKENYMLAGGPGRLSAWWHASHKLTPEGLRFDWRGYLRFWDPRALYQRPWHRMAPRF